jgi:hypothetical protein
VPTHLHKAFAGAGGQGSMWIFICPYMLMTEIHYSAICPYMLITEIHYSVTSKTYPSVNKIKDENAGLPKLMLRNQSQKVPPKVISCLKSLC